MTTNTNNYEIVRFENEDGFQNGWYVIEVNTIDRHVIWVSDCFSTEEEAKEEMETL